MIARTLNLKPGSVICWKEYPWYKRLWSNLMCSKLPLNRYKPVVDKMELIITKWYDKDIQIYTPTKQYTPAEIHKLKTVYIGYDIVTTEELNTIINCVRANTLDTDTKKIDTVKYYFKINQGK